ncbi:MAG: hypothetical protein L0I76_13070 [Pseudonocardia sp.]|nr:hypothetical protein [Pseudonocardia sp.]
MTEDKDPGEPVRLSDETISDLHSDEAPSGGMKPIPDPSTNWYYTRNENCELWSSPPACNF